MLHRAVLFVASLALSVALGCNELPNQPADTSEMTVRGVTLVNWTRDGYSSPEASAAVDRIASLGANNLVVLITAYQSDAAGSEPMIDWQLTPSESSVTDIIVKAKSLELSVTIKIHIDLYTGEWRGTINPRNPDLWFDRYLEIVAPWAALAEARGAESFVIGTELAGTLEHEEKWRELIAQARRLFFGEITYAASWDEARKVPFWDAVDVVGINFYAPVATRPNAHRFEILREWQPWLDRMQLLHKLTGRDIVLTEIGYRSIDGAGMHPYDFDKEAALDFEEQADLYWAALQAVGDKPWIDGVCWWNWLATGAGDLELKDYTPSAKPAEAELGAAWR